MLNPEKLLNIELLIIKKHEDSLIFNNIFDIISEFIHFDYGTLFLNQEKNKLNPVYSKNDVIVNLATDFNIGKGSGISGWVSNNENPIIFPNFMNKNSARKFKSFVSIPLIINKKLIGVLNLGNKNSEYFKKDNKENFTKLGNQIAIIIYKINIHKELELKNIELKKILKTLHETEKKLNLNKKFTSIGKNTESIKQKINNPLSVIMGFSDLLLKKCNDQSVNSIILAEKLEMILDCARQINTILHDFDH